MTDYSLNPTQEEDEEITYCAVHPERETALRCNKCERYMCSDCAVQTPVGYRCKQCVRQHEDRYYTSPISDYALIFAVAAGVAAIGGAIASAVGFLFLTIIIALPVGGFIGSIALRVTQKRRGRQSGFYAAAGTVIGGFLGAAIRAFIAYPDSWRQIRLQAESLGVQVPPQIPSLTEFVIQSTVTDLSVLLFVGLAAFAVYARYR